MSDRKRVLVVGGGGREHALCWKLAQSPRVEKVFAAPGNDGMKKVAEIVSIDFLDVEKLISFAKEQLIDLIVIGQEAASEAGLADAAKAENILVFGPTKAAAEIETSKVFSKHLMSKANIPTAAYETFDDAEKAREFAHSRPLPVVVKADGLATGKGVVIAENYEQADAAIDEIMVKKIFGDSGNRVVIEDFLKGQEVSTHAFCDGKTAVLFPSSQDHKQIYDGDKGPNTGGMGVIAPVPWVTEDHLSYTQTAIVDPALAQLQKEGRTFNGTLYPGLMIDDDVINLLEFNSRFGDPEAEVYMRLLDSDLFTILENCAAGTLSNSDVTWSKKTAATVILASAGYPKSSRKGDEISGISEAESLEDIVVFHAGTYEKDGKFYTNGGRVLAVTATGNDLDEALRKAYEAVEKISFDGMQYRSDIGRRV
ncbi:MAG TPA: phosphoribosylamine--glycine ligase [Candidatus Saccharimonadales bacterium]